jgi:hypothetical protein
MAFGVILDVHDVLGISSGDVKISRRHDCVLIKNNSDKFQDIFPKIIRQINVGMNLSYCKPQLPDQLRNGINQQPYQPADNRSVDADKLEVFPDFQLQLPA